MKIRALFAYIVIASGVLRADVDIDSLVKVARNSSKNAPAIVADAVSENPKQTLRILTASITAMPDRALEISKAVLKAEPSMSAEIVKSAIKVLPKLADDLVTAAVTLYPEYAADIRKAADDAAHDVETAVASPSESDLGRGAGQGGSSAPAFPSQSIRPDLVSPSS